MDKYEKVTSIRQKDPLKTVRDDVPTILELKKLKAGTLKEKQTLQLLKAQRNAEIMEKLQQQKAQRRKQLDQQQKEAEEQRKQNKWREQQLREELHRKQFEFESKEYEQNKERQIQLQEEKNRRKAVYLEAQRAENEKHLKMQLQKKQQLMESIQKQFELDQQKYQQKLNSSQRLKVTTVLPKIGEETAVKHDELKLEEEEKRKMTMEQAYEVIVSHALKQKELEQHQKFQQQQWQNMQLVAEQLEQQKTEPNPEPLTQGAPCEEVQENEQDKESEATNPPNESEEAKPDSVLSQFDILNQIYVRVLQITVNQQQQVDLKSFYDIVQVSSPEQFMETYDDVVEKIQCLSCSTEIREELQKFYEQCKIVIGFDQKYIENICKMFQSVLIYQ